MKTYFEETLEVDEGPFGKQALEAFRLAQQVVRELPFAAFGSFLRCHEVTRAVAHVLAKAFPELTMQVMDGHFGCVEHTWILIPPGDRTRLITEPHRQITHRLPNGLVWGGWILDPYRPGHLPPCQLLDLRCALPGYVGGPARTDVREDVIAHLLQVWREHCEFLDEPVPF